MVKNKVTELNPQLYWMMKKIVVFPANKKFIGYRKNFR